MIYEYYIKHSHGEASGSIEAESQEDAESKARTMYHGQEFPTADLAQVAEDDLSTTNARTDSTTVESVEVREIAA